MLNLVVTTLEELIATLKQLINLAERKKTILIDRKVDELNELVQEEAQVVKRLNQLENERIQLVDSLLEKHPSLSFSQYAEQIPEERLRISILAKLQLLHQLMAELQASNEVNEGLLKDSMSFVHHMIEQVTKSKQQHFNYQSPTGQQKSQTNSRGFFDTKA